MTLERQWICVGGLALLMVAHFVQAGEELEIDDKQLLLTLLNSAKTANGETLFEGDIIVPTPETDSENDVEKWKALPNKGGLWSDKIIPFAFHESVSKNTTNVILDAMSQWEKKTCLEFVPRTTEKQYLKFRTDRPGCFTFVGRKYHEGQDVNLGPGCEHLQITMHEIGHSLGFYHEHSRKDRGANLKILWHNIEKGLTSQFQPGNDSPRGVPYDVTSVMHYSPMSFSSRVFEKNTMVSLDPHLQPLIGRGRGITFRDAKLANMLYSCDDGCPNRYTLRCENEGYLSPHSGGSQPCTCVCPPNTKGRRCETVTGDYYGSIECGGDIQAEGVIETPGYPMRNKAGGSCTWKIQAPAGKRVAVVFEDFSFRPRKDKPSSPYDGKCIHEHVEIRTTSVDEGDMYCGEDIEPGTEMVSTTNVFLILIRADGSGQGRGLKATISHI